MPANPTPTRSTLRSSRPNERAKQGKRPSIRTPDLNALYAQYNYKKFIHPDPLEFLYKYPKEDREVVGLIASALAYGRVAQILRSVDTVLTTMGEPTAYVKSVSPREVRRDFKAFKHRYTTGAEVAAFLLGIKRVYREWGTVENSFAVQGDEQDVRPAMIRFADALGNREKCGSLMADPRKSSAMKRVNLFLRWMVRKDRVDPGGWKKVKPRHLIVPLDTHLHRVARELGLTDRKSADMRTAVEITRALARHNPTDPVKYDFALTRPGIRGEGT